MLTEVIQKKLDQNDHTLASGINRIATSLTDSILEDTLASHYNCASQKEQIAMVQKLLADVFYFLPEKAEQHIQSVPIIYEIFGPKLSLEKLSKIFEITFFHSGLTDYSKGSLDLNFWERILNIKNELGTDLKSIELDLLLHYWKKYSVVNIENSHFYESKSYPLETCSALVKIAKNLSDQSGSTVLDNLIRIEEKLYTAYKFVQRSAWVRFVEQCADYNFSEWQIDALLVAAKSIKLYHVHVYPLSDTFADHIFDKSNFPSIFLEFVGPKILSRFTAKEFPEQSEKLLQSFANIYTEMSNMQNTNNALFAAATLYVLVDGSKNNLDLNQIQQLFGKISELEKNSVTRNLLMSIARICGVKSHGKPALEYTVEFKLILQAAESVLKLPYDRKIMNFHEFTYSLEQLFDLKLKIPAIENARIFYEKHRDIIEHFQSSTLRKISDLRHEPLSADQLYRIFGNFPGLDNVDLQNLDGLLSLAKKIIHWDQFSKSSEHEIADFIEKLLEIARKKPIWSFAEINFGGGSHLTMDDQKKLQNNILSFKEFISAISVFNFTEFLNFYRNSKNLGNGRMDLIAIHQQTASCLTQEHLPDNEIAKLAVHTYAGISPKNTQNQRFIYFDMVRENWASFKEPLNPVLDVDDSSNFIISVRYKQLANYQRYNHLRKGNQELSSLSFSRSVTMQLIATKNQMDLHFNNQFDQNRINSATLSRADFQPIRVIDQDNHVNFAILGTLKGKVYGLASLILTGIHIKDEAYREINYKEFNDKLFDQLKLISAANGMGGRVYLGWCNQFEFFDGWHRLDGKLLSNSEGILLELKERVRKLKITRAGLLSLSTDPKHPASDQEIRYYAKLR